MTEAVTEKVGATAPQMPWGGLLVLFSAGFLSIINETTPAGLLPQIADALGVDEPAAGQLVTVYAVATALTAVPLSLVLVRWGRRTVLIAALGAFVVANLVISFTTSFALVLAARFVAGVGAGLIWTNLAAYAGRLAPPALQGRAMAVANAGTPVALSIGLPLGTLLGTAGGWQLTFGAAAVAGILIIIWAFVALPNVPGVIADAEPPRLGATLRSPGIMTILLVMCGFFLAHNVLYTYVAPLSARAGVADRIEWVLLLFGIAALVSIWITGIVIDRHHRLLTVLGMFLLAAAAMLLALLTVHPVFVPVAAVVWGLGFGGGATWFLTAGFRAAGEAIAAPMVTLVNVMIGAGGILGAVLIGNLGVLSLPWAALVIMVPVALVALLGRRHAFPHWTAD